MDRRRMMMGGKMLSVKFSVSEGAENCFLKIDGKKLSAGSYKIEKGGKVICGIHIPAGNPGGRIYLNGETVADAGKSYISKEITYTLLMKENVEITATALGGFIFMNIKESSGN